jgi:hypothetical protein
MAHYNKDAWQLALRLNKEFNQYGSYQCYSPKSRIIGLRMLDS